MTAWQAFTVTPAVLLCVAVIGGGVSFLELTGRATGGARLVAGGGTVGIALVLYRFVVRPVQSELVHPAWGMYLGLIACACLVAGGLIASHAGREDRQPQLMLQPFDPTPGEQLSVPTHSVPPPPSRSDPTGQAGGA